MLVQRPTISLKYTNQVGGWEKMTTKTPRQNRLDKLLNLLGKKRAVSIPVEVYKKVGQYAYAHAQRESFWKALLRPRTQPPPAGWVYIEELQVDPASDVQPAECDEMPNESLESDG